MEKKKARKEAKGKGLPSTILVKLNSPLCTQSRKMHAAASLGFHQAHYYHLKGLQLQLKNVSGSTTQTKQGFFSVKKLIEKINVSSKNDIKTHENNLCAVWNV